MHYETELWTYVSGSETNAGEVLGPNFTDEDSAGDLSVRGVTSTSASVKNLRSHHPEKYNIRAKNAGTRVTSSGFIYLVFPNADPFNPDLFSMMRTIRNPFPAELISSNWFEVEARGNEPIMMLFKREILAIEGKGPRALTDVMSQCFICGSFTWALGDEPVKSCRCTSQADAISYSQVSAAA